MVIGKVGTERGNDLLCNMFYSIVVPVYNRPDEIRELLESLAVQQYCQFELVIVEDGSEVPCKDETERYSDQLDIRYFYKPNSGPGLSRNFGAAHSRGDYIIFLDSDCILDPDYLQNLHNSLQEKYTDCFGGPDRAHASFSRLQKAINYSMTSFLTTGGIRGGKHRMDKFYPRSFNMGYSREVFEKTGGFASMRFGEDIDMSLRISEAGFNMRLIPEAYVYHKRRTKFKSFYKQVFNSGIARINLYKRHPQSLKLVHFLPGVFVVGHMGLLVAAWFWYPVLLLIPLYMLLIFADALRSNKDLGVALLAVPAAYIQLGGYGMGFWLAVWKRLIWGQGEFAAFVKKFYS